MRLPLSMAFAAALMLSAAPFGASFAQTATDQNAPVAAPATPAPAEPATPAMPQGMAMTPNGAPAKTKTARKHQTLQQRFDAANTTHDGHLTQPQAAAAKWTYVNKRFSAIDKDHKGYITVDDIHAYSRAQHAARHTGKPAVPAVAPGAAPSAAPAAPTTN